MNASKLGTAIAVEIRKAAASRVLASTAILLVVGVAAIAAAGSSAASSGNEQLAAKFGPLALAGGWSAVQSVAVQVTAAAGFLAFGVGLSWMYGREFADHTIAGLFGLPVTRPALALAKLVVYLMWAVATAVLLTAVVAVTALAIGQRSPDAGDWAGLARLLSLAVMTAALPVPAAWAATVGRGLLPAIATTVAMMTVAQIAVVAGEASGWFPLAAPALWAVAPGTISAAQLLLTAAVPVAFALLTLHAWHRLQLDR